MIDFFVGFQRVKNFFIILDLLYIFYKSLKVMERRVGYIIENFVEKSMINVRKIVFEKEMRFEYILMFQYLNVSEVEILWLIIDGVNIIS